MMIKQRITRNDAEKQDILGSVHEAGHAVGRILSAPALGYDLENAVHSITAREGEFPTTWGPLLSSEMEDGQPGTMEDIRRLVESAQARGISVRSWALAKSFIAMMGPAAEAKFTGKAFSRVWFGTGAANDRQDMARDCAMASVDADAALSEALSQVEAALGRSEVWGLVIALARAIRTSNGLIGGQVAAIARDHLSDLGC